MVAVAPNKQGAWGLLRPLLLLAVIAGPSVLIALREGSARMPLHLSNATSFTESSSEPGQQQQQEQQKQQRENQQQQQQQQPDQRLQQDHAVPAEQKVAKVQELQLVVDAEAAAEELNEAQQQQQQEAGSSKKEAAARQHGQTGGAEAPAAAPTEQGSREGPPGKPKPQSHPGKQHSPGNAEAEDTSVSTAARSSVGKGGEVEATALDSNAQPAEAGKGAAAASKAASSSTGAASSPAAAPRVKAGQAAMEEEEEEEVDEGEDAEASVGEDDYLDEDDSHAVGNAEAAARAAAATVRFPWQNASLPVDDRVEALLARLTPKQKIAQLQSRPGNGIPELGVPAFDWQEECLHGVKVGKSGVVQPIAATIYPLNIAWAATFDDALAHRAASQIGDEMRAHYNRRALEGWTELAYTNCFGPHVHIVRDPRWGRLGETFGEDPLLQSNMAVAHVTGLQGGDGSSTYLKASATCKHFIGNDLEGWQGVTRHNFDANISAADMRDTFMPPFEACVQRARAGSVMCSYNRVNGEPSCVNRELLTDTLRGKMGFDGFVVTDCTAINRMVKPAPEGPFVEEGDSRRASARALSAGADMACHVYNRLFSKDVEPEVLDEAARRVLRARVRQGHFNLVRDLPFPHIDSSRLGHASHKATAREVAAKGSVLLKNEGVLPLNPANLTRLAVLGPYANQPGYIMGKYFGATVEPITTPLQALQAALPNARVTYNSETALVYTSGGVAQDAAACEAADACILFLGSRMSASQKMWTELQFDEHAYDTLAEGEGHDRTTLLLQAEQEKLWQKVASLTTKPLVVVLVHAGPLDIGPMVASPRVGAILSMWHPGQHGSVAVADLLLGRASPSGRTPVTWYKESYCKLPMTDTRMRASSDYPGRTYRYWKGDAPLFPFGHGLSYARWNLSKPEVSLNPFAGKFTGPGGADSSPHPPQVASATVSVHHAGGMPAETSVLLFMRYLGPAGSAAAKGLQGAPSLSIANSGCTRGSNTTDLVQRLVGYRRSGLLKEGATARLSFPLQLGGGSQSSWAGFGDPTPPCGAYALRFGHDQPDAALVSLA